MADNLPLIPGKDGKCGGDVQRVIRAVLRESCALPPLQTCAGEWSERGEPAGGEGGEQDALQRREAGLRELRARRLSRPPPPVPPAPPLNLYKLYAPLREPLQRSVSSTLVSRVDLMPSLAQCATRETSLWVRNVLGRSSDSLLPEPPAPPPRAASRPAKPRARRYVTASTMQLPLSGRRTSPDLEPLLCEPPALQFVNFTPHELHMQELRLVNISKVEVRVSLRPPLRAELGVTLRGRLVVTSGAHTALRVTFLPRSVRALNDRLLIRVSEGRDLLVPIVCYMQAPTLNVVVPTVSSVLSCAPPAVETAEGEPGPVVADPEAVDPVCCPPPPPADPANRSLPGPGDAAGCPLPGPAAPRPDELPVLDLGARLLGAAHSVSFVLYSAEEHVAFFLLTDDEWHSQELTTVTAAGALRFGSWAVWPAWWRGGGRVRGAARCRAACPGLQLAALQVLSTTAVARPLQMLADAVYYDPQHVTLQAHEKNYDICSADDPDCEHYVHLGTAFPRRGVANTVRLFNHSPVTYSFYWSVRTWGTCTCWRQEAADWAADPDPERLCPGADTARLREEAGENNDQDEEETAALLVEPARGSLPPRSERAVTVTVPDVGQRLGEHNVVLLLVLKDIPQKSFPPGFVPMIVSTSTAKNELIPGDTEEEYKTADVVSLQLNARWRVSALQVALQPARLVLPYSRRLAAVRPPSGRASPAQPLSILLAATQLGAGGPVHGRWRVQGAPRDSISMLPTQPQRMALPFQFPAPPDDRPMTDEILLEAEDGEWSSRVSVELRVGTRAPRLRPALRWLGVVPPAQHLTEHLTVHNDTMQNIYWWADVVRWHGENPPRPVCVGRAPCDTCHEASCTCALLRPTRGHLLNGQDVELKYEVNSPVRDGCVATLVRARRTAGDAAQLPPAPPAASRASLLAYRVLAPRLLLNVLPCETFCPCGTSCTAAGGALWRPARALLAGRRACCRLRVRNITPLPAHVHWEEINDENEALRVLFFPKSFSIEAYGEIEVRAVVLGARVSERRVWVRRARVQHAYRPLYLLFDAAIGGVELECWLPLPTLSVCVRRVQREVFSWSERLPETVDECFAWELEKRIKLRLCKCPKRAEYVFPEPRQPGDPTDILDRAPPMAWRCACWGAGGRPLQPCTEPFALQICHLPIRTVRTLTVRLRSAGVVAARWAASAKLGARPPKRTLVADDVWDTRVRSSGACVCVRPAGGVLGARGVADVRVSVYADTWGVYHDQLLIQTEHLQPLVADIWVRAVGCPLRLALATHRPDQDVDDPPTLWMTSADPERRVRARNTSRAPLIVHAYVLRDHDDPHDELPFRLYYRLVDSAPPTCPCNHYAESVESSLEMDTSVELYLGPDAGYQDLHYYRMSPLEQRVEAGAACEWALCSEPPPYPRQLPCDASPPPPPRRPPPCLPLRVIPAAPSISHMTLPTLSSLGISVPRRPPAAAGHDDEASGSTTAVLLEAPPHNILLRIIPAEPQGAEWFRPEPGPARLRVRRARRAGALRLRQDAVSVTLCALSLSPANDTIVQRTVGIKNVGNGELRLVSRLVAGEGPAPAWALRRAAEGGCGPACDGARRPPELCLDYKLPPNSSVEIMLEVAVGVAHGWPSEATGEGAQPPELRPPHAAAAGEASMYDTQAEVDMTAPDNEFYSLSYETRRVYTSQINFYDEYSLLQELPLIVDIEVPVLLTYPRELDFDYVCDEDSRKNYFTVWHTSVTETVTVCVEWFGDSSYMFYPLELTLKPGQKENVYVQYTAKWTGGSCGGTAVVSARGRGWCRAGVRLAARPVRDHRCRLPPHDHTDDPHLLAPLDSHWCQ